MSYLRSLPTGEIIASPGSAVYAFGDSITVGQAASDYTTTNLLSWLGLLRTATGWTISDLAVNGENLVTLNYNTLFPRWPSVADGDTNLFLPLYNDYREQGGSLAELFSCEHSLRASLLCMCIPTSRRILATAAAVVYAGTWTGPFSFYLGTEISPYVGSGIGAKISTADGATATVTLNGSTVYIGFTNRYPVNSFVGKFSVSVDSVVMARVDTTLMGVTTAWQGNTPQWYPQVLRIGGLSEGPHTVVITVNSPGAEECSLEWFAGNADVPINSPVVYCGNAMRMSTAGYSAGGGIGSDAICQQHNDIARRVIGELARDGFNIVPVEVNRRYNPNASTSQLNADTVHPNDVGHSRIAAAFLEAINARMGNERGRITALPQATQAVYAAGTAYSLTATQALLNLTTPASLSLTPGRWRIKAQVNLQFNGASFTASRTVTIKLRNTSDGVDLDNGSDTVLTGIVATVTGQCGKGLIEVDLYLTQTKTIQLFGAVSVVPSAGSLDVVAPGTFIVATYLGPH